MSIEGITRSQRTVGAGFGLVVLVSSVFITSCSGGSSAPQLPSEDLHVSIGPIPLVAGEEKTVCIVVPLGNKDDIVVNSIDVSLASGSHHLIVYQTTSAPTTTPFPCSPFTGLAVGKDTPLVFANRLATTWAFPSGIRQDVPANTMVKVEAHYINPTGSPIQGLGQVTLHTTPKSAAPPYQPASFCFWGTSNIDIPPNASTSTGPLFQTGLAGTHLISITTHQHRLGTGIKVWESAAPGQTGTQIANDANWSAPSWSLITPAFDFDGTNGLTYQCDWNNTTSQKVTFGESALDEMCFVGGYYYPSQGPYLCLDGTCVTRKN
jgi:hypothetical protein